jgi:TonB family protein
MPRLVLAAALGLGLWTPGPASAQADRDFEPIRAWNPDHAKAEPVGDTLRLTRGILWTPRPYADFVLRFDYRPTEPDGGGTLLLRANVWGRGMEAYAVTIDRGPERGRLAPIGQWTRGATLQRSVPITDLDAWITCEVRIDGPRLTVSLDGVRVASTDRAAGLAGTIGFRGGRGGLELRGMRIAEIGAATVISTALPRVGDPGLTRPVAIRRAEPAYTRAAMNARAQGVAKVEFVIEVDGTPGAVRVLDSPHPDLAVAAVACVRRWRFEPATKDGVATAAVATMELAFKLR